MVSGSPGFRVSVVAFTWWGYYRTGLLSQIHVTKYIQFGNGSGAWTVVRSMKRRMGEGGMLLLVYHLNWNVNSLGFITCGTKKKKKKSTEFSLTTKVLSVTHGGLAKLFIQARSCTS